ncbi:MAG TPA: VCBS repeat-containing protein, partial [Gaiellaceae bacterium]
MGERTSHTLTLPAGTYHWSVQAVDSGFAGSAFSDEGTFTIVAFPEISAVLTGVRDSSVAWGDYDSDGDLDILLTGHDGTNPITKIYRNDAGVFTDIAAGLTGVYDGSVAWGDYDSDGDLDILLTGHDGTNPITKIYHNDDGVFTDIAAVLSGVEWGSVAWGDYDSDGDLDILLAGYTGTTRIAKIYRNDDSDGFTDIGAGLTGVSYGSVAWGDYDSDGDLDILLAGWDGTTPRVTKIYRNDGSSGFTSIDAGLTRVYRGSVAWGDYDSDGDLDILLTGHDGTNPITKIY